MAISLTSSSTPSSVSNRDSSLLLVTEGNLLVSDDGLSVLDNHGSTDNLAVLDNPNGQLLLPAAHGKLLVVVKYGELLMSATHGGGNSSLSIAHNDPGLSISAHGDSEGGAWVARRDGIGEPWSVTARASLQHCSLVPTTATYCGLT